MHIWGAYVCQTEDEPSVKSSTAGSSEVVGIEAFIDMRLLQLYWPAPRPATNRVAFPTGSWRKMYLSQPPCNFSTMVHARSSTLQVTTFASKVAEIWDRWSYVDVEGSKVLADVERFAREDFFEPKRKSIAGRKKSIAEDGWAAVEVLLDLAEGREPGGPRRSSHLMHWYDSAVDLR